MGKLWKKIRFRLSAAIPPETAATLTEIGKEALEKTQSGLELKYIDGPEADAAQKLSTAASLLIGSLEGVNEAVLQVGPILVVKRGSKIVVKTISTDLRRILDANPKIMNSPHQLLSRLEKLGHSEDCDDRV